MNGRDERAPATVLSGQPRTEERTTLSSRSHRVVQLRTPLSEDERLSLVEQTVLCHPAVQAVEIEPGAEIRAEVVVWRGSSPQRVVHDIAAALDAVCPDVAVCVSVAGVAYKRRATVLYSVYK
ncbi:hypothetical protein [Lentzea sp. NPDC003310]|uniref:hypothetical protein n=1 Tax=Lentzea sp. NPDC003310 TaxID=3154447 RepID=UPI0033B526C0